MSSASLAFEVKFNTCVLYSINQEGFQITLRPWVEYGLEYRSNGILN